MLGCWSTTAKFQYFVNEGWRKGAFLRRKQPRKQPHLPPSSLVEVFFTPDSTALATVSDQGLVSFIDVSETFVEEACATESSSNAPRDEQRAHPAAAVRCAVFLNPSAPSAAVCGSDNGQLFMTDAKWSRPVELASFDGHARAVAALGTDAAAAAGSQLVALGLHARTGAAPGSGGGGGGGKGLLALMRVAPGLRRRGAGSRTNPWDGEVAAVLGGWRVTPEAITALSPVSWDPGMLFAGTTGGSVDVLSMGDGQPRQLRSCLIGQCACPVHAVTTSAALGGVVLASFHHNTMGTGHVQGCLVWDIRAEERVAALRLGGTISGTPGASGHRATEPCVIHSDSNKVVLAVADRATVFETRMWRPMYSIALVGGKGTVNRLQHQGRVQEWATAVHAHGSRLAVATASGRVSILEAEGLQKREGVDIERAPVSHQLRL